MVQSAQSQTMAATVSRRALWAAIAAALALFLGWAFWPKAVPVDLGVVTRGPMEVYVEGEGQTRVRDIYQISAPVTGRVLRIEAEAGDAVVANGSVLVVIEPADPTFLDDRSRAEAEAAQQAAEDAEAQAEAVLEQVMAEHKFARGELKRAQTLAKEGTVSKRALEVAELAAATQQAAVKSAEATLKIRNHELETARARLIAPTTDHHGNDDCCIEMRSPINGTVLRVLLESEGVVAVGTPLMEIGNPRDLEIVVDLLTSDAVRIDEGAVVKIDNWGGPELVGRVRRIEPYGYTKVSVLGIEEQRIDVLIDFSLSAALPENLGHGFRVETAILEWKGDAIVQAPISALFRSRGSWVVYLDDDGRSRLINIEVGHMNDDAAEVLSGLNPGDRVVVHPGDRVSDDIAITPRSQ